jgi:hypothetical protein
MKYHCKSYTVPCMYPHVRTSSITIDFVTLVMSFNCLPHYFELCCINIINTISWSSNSRNSSFVSRPLSVRSHVTTLLPHWTDFYETDIWVLFEHLSRKFRFDQNVTRIAGTLHGDLCTVMIVSHRIFLRMRYVSDKIQRKSNKHFIFNEFFSRKSCCLWDNVNKYGRGRQATDDNIIRRLRLAWRMTKARIQTRTQK